MFNTDMEFVSSLWADFDNLPEDTGLSMLGTGHIECLKYVSPLEDGVEVPDNYLLAEIMFAKDAWSKLSGGNSTSFGSDGYERPVYPLYYAARDLLIPKASPLTRLR